MLSPLGLFSDMGIVYLQYLLGIAFLTIIYMHVTKKNGEVVVAYSIQSLAITAIIFNSFMVTKNIPLLIIVLLTLIVKVIMAPVFFMNLIKKHELIFTVSSYLNMPITLISIAIITGIAHSNKFLPLTSIIPEHQSLLALALSSILLSFFLIVNKKGALSQIVGVLTFENSIVAFTLFAGLEQSIALQIGIIFDIFVWLIISTVFISLIYKHFRSLDVTIMRSLRD